MVYVFIFHCILVRRCVSKIEVFSHHGKELQLCVWRSNWSTKATPSFFFSAFHFPHRPVLLKGRLFDAFTFFGATHLLATGTTEQNWSVHESSELSLAALGRSRLGLALGRRQKYRNHHVASKYAGCTRPSSAPSLAPK